MSFDGRKINHHKFIKIKSNRLEFILVPVQIGRRRGKEILTHLLQMPKLFISKYILR